MDGETRKKYRVKIKNSKDNLTYVPFPDLVIKFTNGYAEPLKIKEGEEIPLTACDPEDIRKSWLVGSLKRYTDTGWIEEIHEEKKSKIIEVPPPIVGTGNIPLIEVPILSKTISNKVEEKQEVPTNLSNAEVSSNATLSNFSLVKTYSDFEKLSYFLKLRFIKESNDVPLLKEISEKTPSHQFKNNISIKLAK